MSTLATEPMQHLTPVAQPLAEWPGHERREPPLQRADYLHLQALLESLESAIGVELAGQRNLRVLDLGCGHKPYLPLFAPYLKQYVGIDINPGVAAPDSVATAEFLPFADTAFDVVFSTQAFGYVNSPLGALAEIRRVLVPGGLALISTHGTYPYIGDYWRYTNIGLQKLFVQAGFTSVHVVPNGGALLCMLQMNLLLIDALTGYGTRISPQISGPVYAAANQAARALAKFDPTNGEKFASLNYTVRARKPLGSH